MLTVERLTNDSMVLGESPVWDHRSGLLMWVDITKGEIHTLSDNSARRVMSFSTTVGCVALATDGSLIAGAGRRIVEVDTSGDFIDLARPAKRRTRMNDGAVDSAGRLWIGSCPLQGDRPRGSLFRIARGMAPAEVLTGVGLSNGIGWSPDSSSMYYIDTPTGRVDAFAFESATGTIHSRRPFAQVPDDLGVPDGLCVDSTGNVWVAVWGGGRLLVYSEEGVLTEEVLVPVANVTSACFGGPALSTVFITTARTAPSDPTSGGAVYITQSPTVGMPSNIFRIASGEETS